MAISPCPPNPTPQNPVLFTVLCRVTLLQVPLPWPGPRLECRPPLFSPRLSSAHRHRERFLRLYAKARTSPTQCCSSRLSPPSLPLAVPGTCLAPNKHWPKAHSSLQSLLVFVLLVLLLAFTAQHKSLDHASQPLSGKPTVFSFWTYLATTFLITAGGPPLQPCSRWWSSHRGMYVINKHILIVKYTLMVFPKWH